ncbi:MAG TPA: Fic family protein [Candidatus Baltobacteraceae bacterium]|nr:Fic family protein [Candidatus Baltobacteraceae bacterium]
MVRLRTRKVGNGTYYYLEHSLVINGKTTKRERYLGKSIPKDIERVRSDFESELKQEVWYPRLDSIRKNFGKEMRSMPKEAVEKYIDNFSIRFTYNTNRIEGSMLSLKDTSALIEHGISPMGRLTRDMDEAEAHNTVFHEMLDTRAELTLGLILKWHRQLFDKTKPGIAGRLREHRVYITGSKFLPPIPQEVQSRIIEFFRWYDKAKRLMNPVELAALCHLKFETIHPFTDGNGRVGRLIMNFVLNKNGYPMLDIPYTNRMSYYNALERAQTRGVERTFVIWFFKRYVKENSDYIA